MILPAAWEDVIDASGVAPQIEAMLPIGVRHRQLSVRTLLAGMCLTQADGRPAHLTRVHRALTSLPEDDQARLGVTADWKGSPHLLTYRQTERTSGLVAKALGKDQPDGKPPQALQAVCDHLLEASVPEELKDASTSLAVDWSDLETFSRPPPAKGGDCADPEASWGHRKNNLAGSEDELFFGYYLSAAIMMPDEHGPAVPELARRATLSSCRHDPVPQFAEVLTAMPAAGVPLGDVLSDSGYAHRIPQHRAVPLRAAGATLIQDLHPHDRGPKGTHDGAIIANGNLYCPRTPHRQGPRQQRHRPRLVPPHGPSAPHAGHHLPARRPQPAHPHRLDRPAGRKPAPRRRRPAPENPPAPPQDPRRPRRRTTLTPAPPRPRARASHHQQPGTSTPADSTNQLSAPPQHPKTPARAHQGQAAAMSDPNVKLGLTET